MQSAVGAIAKNPRDLPPRDSWTQPPLGVSIQHEISVTQTLQTPLPAQDRSRTSFDGAPCPGEKQGARARLGGETRDDSFVLLVGKSIRSLLRVLNEAARRRHGHSMSLR